MKIKILFRLGLTILSLLILSQILFAQSNSIKKLTIDRNGRDFTLSTSKELGEDVIGIYLKNHGEDNIAILRVATTVTSSINVKAWQVKYKENAQADPLVPRRLKAFESVVIVPEDDINFNGKTLHINERSSKISRCMVDIAIPAGKRVALYIDNDLKYSGKPTNNLLIRGVELFPNAIEVASNTLLAQMIAYPSKDTKNLQHIRQGAVIAPPDNSINRIYTVSWNTLKEYLKDPIPDTSTILSQKQDCAECSVAILRLALDTEGNISKLEQIGGNKDVAVVAIAALYQCKFNPFLAGGRAVAVQSIVPVKIENGKILFDSDSK